jgi:hypothetical protein
MKTGTQQEVTCTECRWWDWAVGCAEDFDVDDPRARRACLGFTPLEAAGTAARPGAGRPGPEPVVIACVTPRRVA